MVYLVYLVDLVCQVYQLSPVQQNRQDRQWTFYQYSLQACSTLSPKEPSNCSAFYAEGPWDGFYCARRTSTGTPCAFREQGKLQRPYAFSPGSWIGPAHSPLANITS